MKQELDKELCRLAPTLFADRFGAMKNTAMCWGFDIGDGWFSILKEVALKLEHILAEYKKNDPQGWQYGFYRATQVKEKYGTLRIYMSGSNDEIDAIIDKAESQSSKTCEVCGKPGKTRGGYWIVTRCLKCWKKEKSDAK